jgi:polyhydroxyalkanoic acid synthase PhaR subunit
MGSLWIARKEPSMANNPPKVGPETRSLDPFQAWRTFYQASEKNWEAFFHEVLATDTFAATLGRTLEGYLNTQGAFAKAVERYMEQYLKAINVPSRADITRIAGMIVSLENKVDEIAATVELLEGAPAALKRIDAEVANVVTRTAGLSGIKRELDQVRQATTDVATRVAEQERTLQQLVAQQQALQQQTQQEHIPQRLTDQQEALQELRRGMDELRTLLLEQIQRNQQTVANNSAADNTTEPLAPEAGEASGNGIQRPTRRRPTAEPTPDVAEKE